MRWRRCLRLAHDGEGFSRCAVHQQTQRTYAIGVGEDGSSAVWSSLMQTCRPSPQSRPQR
eukprot:scaffold39233_cov77-Phaeocystis_antarctica.AAC.3